MEERRSNGFRVKPSFGQVLGYIQEGEPLTLDLPSRKAPRATSISTTTPMPRSPSATPRCLTPRSIPRPPSRR